MDGVPAMWTWACRRERNMCSKKRLRKRIPHLIVLGCTSSFFADYGRRGGNKYDREHDLHIQMKRVCKS